MYICVCVHTCSSTFFSLLIERLSPRHWYKYKSIFDFWKMSRWKNITNREPLVGSGWWSIKYVSVQWVAKRMEARVPKWNGKKILTNSLLWEDTVYFKYIWCIQSHQYDPQVNFEYTRISFDHTLEGKWKTWWQIIQKSLNKMLFITLLKSTQSMLARLLVSLGVVLANRMKTLQNLVYEVPLYNVQENVSISSILVEIRWCWNIDR